MNAISKLKAWITSAAGKISIFLIIISVVMLFAAYLHAVNDGTNINNFLYSSLVGLATNLLGIIVTVTFVQRFITKQEIKEKKEFEAKRILRYNRIIELYLKKYVVYYNLVVTPNTEINNIELDNPRIDFVFKDMKDLHMPSLLEGDPFFGKSTINLFFDTEKEVANSFKIMIENVDFVYYDELFEIINSFLICYISPNIREGILDNEKVYSGEGNNRQKITSQVAKDISDDKYDWVELMDKGPRNANMMGPYVKLYHMLKAEGELLNDYRKTIIEIEQHLKNK